MPKIKYFCRNGYTHRIGTIPTITHAIFTPSGVIFSKAVRERFCVSLGLASISERMMNCTGCRALSNLLFLNCVYFTFCGL